MPFRRFFFIITLILSGTLAVFSDSSSWALRQPLVTAKSAVVLDARNGGVLYSKNPHLRLPQASTTKLMTAILVLENLPMDRKVAISRAAFGISPSKAGLTLGARYKARDLLIAALVSSSNDAAVALAEAVAGSEKKFVRLMNTKAKQLGMLNTRFVNSTGLTDKRHTQYSTAYDLTILMRHAAKDSRVDEIMGITTTFIYGSDARQIYVKSHNKMLWRIPKFVKGKTGWTYASRHTFVGTNYSSNKTIAFAMLRSNKPWSDIERLMNFGLVFRGRD